MVKTPSNFDSLSLLFVYFNHTQMHTSIAFSLTIWLNKKFIDMDVIKKNERNIVKNIIHSSSRIDRVWANVMVLNLCCDCVHETKKTKQNRHDRRSHHDDGAATNSCIEIGNAYWPLKSLSIVTNRDRSNSMVAQHFQWPWLTLRCCNDDRHCGVITF